MTVKWTEDLATDVKSIDTQHKEIFRRLGDLYQACKEGRGRQEISQMISFLEEYVVSHFSEEEKLMADLHYPSYAPHKAEHIDFIRRIVDLKRRLEKEGPSLALVVATNMEVSEWLKRHIRKADVSFGAFLRTRP